MELHYFCALLFIRQYCNLIFDMKNVYLLTRLISDSLLNKTHYRAHSRSVCKARRKNRNETYNNMILLLLLHFVQDVSLLLFVLIVAQIKFLTL